MKKILTITFFILLLFLTGCGSSSDTSEHQADKDNVKMENKESDAGTSIQLRAKGGVSEDESGSDISKTSSSLSSGEVEEAQEGTEEKFSGSTGKEFN